MNVIFTVILLLSAITMCISAPQDFLPATISGVKGAAECALTLLCIYIVWMGLSAVAEDCRLTAKASKLLTPVCRKIFRTENAEAIKDISMNVSCNLLGIGGAATPYAVKAIGALEKDGNVFAQNLLFIINATSIQLIPATVIALRAAAGSVAAYDITLPSFLATCVSTLTGAFLYILYDRLQKRKKGRKTTV